MYTDLVMEHFSNPRNVGEIEDADGVGQIARTSDDDAWQLSQLQREINEVLRRSADRADTALRLADVHAMLGGQLAGRPTRANFRTGTLTVCTMVPMRSVPHRVVCLVGLDDTVFPRLGSPDGDDVLARRPRTGERDVRSEDRQLLLDAVCAATEKLVITYTGANEFTGRKRPPAVPLMELLDALDASTENAVRETILIRHPLQPFDIKNVTPGKLGVPGEPFSFDPTALSGAVVMTAERPAQPDFFADPLPAAPAGDVGLAELLAFYRDPIRGFFAELDFTLPRDFNGVDDAMPVEVDNLQQWVVGDRMLTDIVAGMDPQQARQAEWRRGLLPPGWLGCHTVNELRDQAMQLAAVAAHCRVGDPQAFDVDVDLGNGRRLTGTVSQVFGDRTVSLTFSKLGGQHLLAAWIPLLAMAVAMPERDWSAVCIGRAAKGNVFAQRVLRGPRDDARAILRDLVDMRDAGRREPLPMPIKTSYAWAAARFETAKGTYRRRPPNPESDARRRWKYDRDEPAVQRIWGKDPDLDALLTAPSPAEHVEGESTRLGCYAARLWLPMLNAEGTLG